MKRKVEFYGVPNMKNEELYRELEGWLKDRDSEIDFF